MCMLPYRVLPLIFIQYTKCASLCNFYDIYTVVCYLSDGKEITCPSMFSIEISHALWKSLQMLNIQKEFVKEQVKIKKSLG